MPIATWLTGAPIGSGTTLPNKSTTPLSALTPLLSVCSSHFQDTRRQRLRWSAAFSVSRSCARPPISAPPCILFRSCASSIIILITAVYSSTAICLSRLSGLWGCSCQTCLSPGPEIVPLILMTWRVRLRRSRRSLVRRVWTVPSILISASCCRRLCELIELIYGF